MEDLLMEVLEELEYPIRRQGSLAEDEAYPDHFFTFWNNAGDGEHYDDEETTLTWDYDLNFYSIDPAKTYEVLRMAKKLLQKAGFIVSGTGYDVPSDEITHTGRGINVLFREDVDEGGN